MREGKQRGHEIESQSEVGKAELACGVVACVRICRVVGKAS